MKIGFKIVKINNILNRKIIQKTSNWQAIYTLTNWQNIQKNKKYFVKVKV